jgi:hypothetical protein
MLRGWPITADIVGMEFLVMSLTSLDKGLTSPHMEARKNRGYGNAEF